jgi:predicted DNA-binding protein with PD1-like motif
VTALGAVERASLRYYDQQALAYRDFTIDEPLEVVAAVGNVSLLDGEPFLHLHAALAAADGRGYGGHVHSGTVAFALEATVTVLDGEPPVRRHDAATGLTLWAPQDGPATP